MSFRPLDGYIEFPLNEKPEDPHLGLSYDYEFAGKRMGEQVILLVHSWIIDSRGRIFSRKGSYILHRTDAREGITRHIKKHLVEMGVDDMSCRRLMRDFEVDNGKLIKYDTLEFRKIVK